MTSNKTISEVVTDENGIVILKQLQSTTAKIEQKETSILQEINALGNEFIRLDTFGKSFANAPSGFQPSMGVKGGGAHISESITLEKEVGELVYITEMQVARLSRTVQDDVLPAIIMLLAQTGNNKNEGGSSFIKNLIEGGELGNELGGPYGAASVVILKLFNHWLNNGNYADPRKDEQGNTMIGDEDVKHHVNRDVQDQTSNTYQYPSHTGILVDGKVVSTGENNQPEYNPKLVDSFLHINLNDENSLDSKIFEADLKAWLATHPKEQLEELQKDYTPKQVYALQQLLKKDLGYNSIEEAFSDERNTVASFYLDALHSRELSKEEKQRIKKENEQKHKAQFEDSQKELLIHPTISDGGSQEYNNINPYIFKSSSPGQAVSASAAIGKEQMEDLSGQGSGVGTGFSLGNSNANAPAAAAPVMNNTINISSGSPASSASGITSSGMEGDILPSATKVNASSNSLGNQGGGRVTNIYFNHQSNDTHHSQTAMGKEDIHDEVVAVLTSAVADARIGIDVH